MRLLGCFFHETTLIRPRNGYLATDIYTLLINRGTSVSGATAALGIAAASFGGDGEDEGGDGGAKDTAESPTALPERPQKNNKTCEASANHSSTKRHELDMKGFSTKRHESDTNGYMATEISTPY